MLTDQYLVFLQFTSIMSIFSLCKLKRSCFFHWKLSSNLFFLLSERITLIMIIKLDIWCMTMMINDHKHDLKVIQSFIEVHIVMWG